MCLTLSPNANNYLQSRTYRIPSWSDVYCANCQEKFLGLARWDTFLCDFCGTLL